MKRLGTSFGSGEPHEPCPLPCLKPHNLNHVSVFLVTLLLSCLPLGKPLLTYPSRRDSVFFLFHSTVAPIISFCSKVFFHQSFFSPKFFLLLPPGSCHPFFTFHYPFHLPDFLQPACFSACLLLLSVASALRKCLCQFAGCELDWRGECVCQVLSVRVQR